MQPTEREAWLLMRLRQRRYVLEQKLQTLTEDAAHYARPDLYEQGYAHGLRNEASFISDLIMHLTSEAQPASHRQGSDTLLEWLSNNQPLRY